MRLRIISDKLSLFFIADVLAFRCAYCYFLNPARKTRPQAPRLPEFTAETKMSQDPPAVAMETDLSSAPPAPGTRSPAGGGGGCVDDARILRDLCTVLTLLILEGVGLFTAGSVCVCV